MPREFALHPSLRSTGSRGRLGLVARLRTAAGPTYFLQLFNPLYSVLMVLEPSLDLALLPPSSR